MDLILGHNQFIGISHTSEERGIELQKKFYNVASIYRVVETAAGMGYKNMIIETHPKMLEFLDYYLKSQTFDMNFYLQVQCCKSCKKRLSFDGYFCTPIRSSAIYGG